MWPSVKGRHWTDSAPRGSESSSSFAFSGPCIQIGRLVCNAKLLSAEGLPLVTTTSHQALPLWTRSGFSRHRRWSRTEVDDQVVWNKCRKGSYQMETTPVWRGGRGVDNVKVLDRKMTTCRDPHLQYASSLRPGQG